MQPQQLLARPGWARGDFSCGSGTESADSGRGSQWKEFPKAGTGRRVASRVLGGGGGAEREYRVNTVKHGARRARKERLAPDGPSSVASRSEVSSLTLLLASLLSACPFPGACTVVEALDCFGAGAGLP